MNYSVIAIEREYASGGSEIGEKLGEKLGIPCYGEEVLERAAEKIGISVSELRKLEESITGSILYSIHMLSRIPDGGESVLTKAQRLSIAEIEVMKEMIYSPCVIVGRCAPAVFRDNDRVLKVFIHGDMELRKKRAIECYHNDPKNAESILKRYDKKRAQYFKSVSGSDWKNADVYHIMLDSGKFGIDTVVDILYDMIKKKPIESK